MQIRDTVALISGGGSGLGEATARRLANEGATIVVLDRDGVKASAVAESLPGDHLALSGDVTKPDTIQAALDAAKGLGTLRTVVNTAGVGWAKRTLSRDGTPHDLDTFKLVIDINLVGSFNVLTLAASAMIDNALTGGGERGVIINTASIAAFDGQIGQIAYAASKGGVVGLTLPAARDLAKVGIRVVTIAPGLFNTPLLAALPEAAREALVKNIPHPHRLGDPPEFAHLCQSIVENAYFNGETVRLDASLRMPPK